MDFFGKKKVKELEQSHSILLEQVKALQTLNRNNLISSLSQFLIPNWEVFKEIQAYVTFDDVYSVVSRIAAAAAKLKLVAYNEGNGEDLPPTDEYNKYLKTLTLQDRYLLMLYLLLSGEVFMYKDRLRLGPNKGKLTTYSLHPNFVTVIVSTSFPQQILGYRYQDTSSTIYIEKEDMAFIKYPNPSTDPVLRWRGVSPIKALTQRLNRLKSNMNITVAQLQNSGVKSIVYDKTPGIEASVMSMHKDNFANFVKNQDNAGAPYFSAGEMGSLNLGSTLVDMQALSMADIDFDKICNAYSISSTLFNNKSASTESNVKEMRKDMYTNAVLPSLDLLLEGMTLGFADVFGEGKCIRYDISTISELQQDTETKARAWAAMPAIVINEMRKDLGLDKSTDPMADVLLFKDGYGLGEDLKMPDEQPLDNLSNDYNGNASQANSRAGNTSR